MFTDIHLCIKLLEQLLHLDLIEALLYISAGKDDEQVKTNIYARGPEDSNRGE
jgi:hypothetical protein